MTNGSDSGFTRFCADFSSEKEVPPKRSSVDRARRRCARWSMRCPISLSRDVGGACRRRTFRPVARCSATPTPPPPATEMPPRAPAAGQQRSRSEVFASPCVVPLWQPHACLWSCPVNDRRQPTETLLPRRWVIERTIAWLNRNRRLAKAFEARIETATAWLYIASLKLLSRRLARS
jgi:hypothetical protein